MNSMSLAAIEAELKPKVLETFDAIADAFKPSADCRTRTSTTARARHVARPALS